MPMRKAEKKNAGAIQLSREDAGAGEQVEGGAGRRQEMHVLDRRGGAKSIGQM